MNKHHNTNKKSLKRPQTIINRNQTIESLKKFQKNMKDKNLMFQKSNHLKQQKSRYSVQTVNLVKSSNLNTNSLRVDPKEKAHMVKSLRSFNSRINSLTVTEIASQPSLQFSYQRVKSKKDEEVFQLKSNQRLVECELSYRESSTVKECQSHSYAEEEEMESSNTSQGETDQDDMTENMVITNSLKQLDSEVFDKEEEEFGLNANETPLQTPIRKNEQPLEKNQDIEEKQINWIQKEEEGGRFQTEQPLIGQKTEVYQRYFTENPLSKDKNEYENDQGKVSENSQIDDAQKEDKILIQSFNYQSEPELPQEVNVPVVNDCPQKDTSSEKLYFSENSSLSHDFSNNDQNDHIATLQRKNDLKGENPHFSQWQQMMMQNIKQSHTEGEEILQFEVTNDSCENYYIEDSLVNLKYQNIGTTPINRRKIYDQNNNNISLKNQIQKVLQERNMNSQQQILHKPKFNKFVKGRFFSPNLDKENIYQESVKNLIFKEDLVKGGRNEMKLSDKPPGIKINKIPSPQPKRAQRKAYLGLTSSEDEGDYGPYPVKKVSPELREKLIRMEKGEELSPLTKETPPQYESSFDSQSKYNKISQSDQKISITTSNEVDQLSFIGFPLEYKISENGDTVQINADQFNLLMKQYAELQKLTQNDFQGLGLNIKESDDEKLKKILLKKNIQGVIQTTKQLSVICQQLKVFYLQQVELLMGSNLDDDDPKKYENSKLVLEKKIQKLGEFQHFEENIVSSVVESLRNKPNHMQVNKHGERYFGGVNKEQKGN